MKRKAKERLIEKALELFNRHGFNAVGIDTILKESGVAKNTLYRHFGSKEELILAVLRKHDEDFRTRLAQSVEIRSGATKDRITALFDVYESWTKRHDFYGCLFINAAAEFPEANSPVHRLCSEHKQSMVDYIQTNIESAKFSNTETLALRLFMLLDGAVTYTYITGEKLALQEAKTLAEEMIRSWEGQRDAA